MSGLIADSRTMVDKARVEGQVIAILSFLFMFSNLIHLFKFIKNDVINNN